MTPDMGRDYNESSDVDPSTERDDVTGEPIFDSGVAEVDDDGSPDFPDADGDDADERKWGAQPQPKGGLQNILEERRDGRE